MTLCCCLAHTIIKIPQTQPLATSVFLHPKQQGRHRYQQSKLCKWLCLHIAFLPYWTQYKPQFSVGVRMSLAHGLFNMWAVSLQLMENLLQLLGHNICTLCLILVIVRKISILARGVAALRTRSCWSDANLARRDSPQGVAHYPLLGAPTSPYNLLASISDSIQRLQWLKGEQARLRWHASSLAHKGMTHTVSVIIPEKYSSSG